MTIPFVIDNQQHRMARACSLADILSHLPAELSRRTVQDNLRLLLQLELVDLRGERRWARWMLKGTPDRA
jgi:hypothetical protein